MTRKSRRELERALDDLSESSNDGDREIVGPNGILAPPERFGYGRDVDGGETDA
jgi:hypothetical protein